MVAWLIIYDQITLEVTIQHLSEPFKAKVVVVPDTDYHNIAPLLIGTAVLRHSRDNCRDQYGIWYIQKENLSVAWVCADQYLNTLDNSSHTAKMVKSINIHPGRIVTLPVVTRTLGVTWCIWVILLHICEYYGYLLWVLKLST